MQSIVLNNNVFDLFIFTWYPWSILYRYGTVGAIETKQI